ncbi:MAG: hypothetical protein U9Q07_08600 [Planctomycetota bacterium]|nr:hypothetical protein [Planctomycetota bacterium]
MSNPGATGTQVAEPMQDVRMRMPLLGQIGFGRLKLTILVLQILAQLHGLDAIRRARLLPIIGCQQLKMRLVLRGVTNLKVSGMFMQFGHRGLRPYGHILQDVADMVPMMMANFLARSLTAYLCVRLDAERHAIDLNTVPLETLRKLPHIAEKRGKQIRKSRPFASLDDPMLIQIVGGKDLAKIRDLIQVTGEPPSLT